MNKKKIQAIADENVLQDLSPKQTSQVFDAIDTEAFGERFFLQMLFQEKHLLR